MTDQDELMLLDGELDPAFLDVTDQITERLQAGEEIDVRDYLGRYPQWAGAICKLLPTIQGLVDYGESVDRGPWIRRQQINPNDANTHKP